MKQLVVAVVLVAGCSDLYLDKADDLYPVSRESSLETLAGDAGNLSSAYLDAARSTRTVQDLLSFTILASAGAAASGALGTVSDEILLNRAFVGVTAQVGGARLAPGSAIRAIYNGAKRLNCISTAAGIGVALGLDGPDKRAAEVATIGSIEHVRIMTREGIVREVADFGALFDEFTSAGENVVESLALSAVDGGSARTLTSVPFNQYLKLIAKCVGEKSDSVLNEVPSAT